jgi:hypothetical protein
MLMIVGIDSNTNIIKTLRMVSMPMKLFNLFNKIWSVNLNHDGFSEEYNKWINDIDNQYSVHQIYGMAVSYGIMGQKEFI